MGNINKTKGRFAPSTGKGPKTKTPPPVPKQSKITMTPTEKPSQRTQQIKATLSGEDANTRSTLGG